MKIHRVFSCSYIYIYIFALWWWIKIEKKENKREKWIWLLRPISSVQWTKVYKVNRGERRKKKRTRCKLSSNENFQCRHRHLYLYIEKRKREQNERSRVKTLSTLLSLVFFFLAYTFYPSKRQEKANECLVILDLSFLFFNRIFIGKSFIGGWNIIHCTRHFVRQVFSFFFFWTFFFLTFIDHTYYFFYSLL